MMPSDLIERMSVMPDLQGQIGNLIHRYITTGELIGTEVGAKVDTQIHAEMIQGNHYRHRVPHQEYLQWPWTTIFLGNQE